MRYVTRSSKLTALRGLLRSPRLYIGWQRILGADRLRRLCLHEFLKLREGERVLDIGCGPGYILDYMPPVDYIGFDTEAGYIESTKTLFRSRKFLLRAFCAGSRYKVQAVQRDCAARNRPSYG
jgi:SAM-dependent methyltransferase